MTMDDIDLIRWVAARVSRWRMRPRYALIGRPEAMRLLAQASVKRP